jgi:hypothetical protein
LLFALAGIAFAAMLSGAVFLLMGNAASSGDESPLGPQQATTPSHAQHHPRTRDAGAEVVTQPSNVTRDRPGPQSQAPNPTRTAAAQTASRPAPNGPAPTRSPVSTPTSSAATSSSAPPSSTTPAPSTSTSPAPSTSAVSTALAEPSP